MLAGGAWAWAWAWFSLLSCQGPSANRTRTREARPAQRLVNGIARGGRSMDILDREGQQGTGMKRSGVFGLGRARHC